MGAGRERAEPVDVDLDAALDDAGDEAEDGGLLLERLLHDRPRAIRAPRVVREDDEPAPRAVAVDDGDEVGPHLEDDAGNLRIAGRLGLGGRLGSGGRLGLGLGCGHALGFGRGFGRGLRLGPGLGRGLGLAARLGRRLGRPGGLGRGLGRLEGRLVGHGRRRSLALGRRLACGPRLDRRGSRRARLVLVVADEELEPVEDRPGLAGQVDQDRVLGDLEDLAEDDVADIDGRALARRPVALFLLAVLLRGACSPGLSAPAPSAAASPSPPASAPSSPPGSPPAAPASASPCGPGPFLRRRRRRRFFSPLCVSPRPRGARVALGRDGLDAALGRARGFARRGRRRHGLGRERVLGGRSRVGRRRRTVGRFGIRHEEEGRGERETNAGAGAFPAGPRFGPTRSAARPWPARRFW